MKKTVILLLFTNLAFLSGCASTQAQREYQAMQKNAADTNLKLDECIKELEQNPSVQIVYEKVVVKPEKDGFAINRFELVRKNDYLSEDLRNHLIVYLSQKNKCDQIRMEGGSRYNLRIYQKMLEMKTKLDGFTDNLINQKITIGEFNTKRIELRAQEKQELLTIEQQISGDLKLRHDIEVEKDAQEWQQNYQRELDRQSRERAARNLNPQPYKTILPPVYNTNCYRIGNNLNCTTQ